MELIPTSALSQSTKSAISDGIMLGAIASPPLPSLDVPPDPLAAPLASLPPVSLPPVALGLVVVLLHESASRATPRPMRIELDYSAGCAEGASVVARPALRHITANRA